MVSPLMLGLMVVLLATSAFFSASETALFSLERTDRARAGSFARRLLLRPQDLLVSVLLANLLVNLLFFAFASRLEESGAVSPWLSGLLALVAILIFGEILPKTAALRAPIWVARFSAVPLTALVAVLWPLRQAFGGLLFVIFRALGSASQSEVGITTEMLDRVLAKSAEDGLIESGEADLLSEVLELEDIRVREIMTPRVDMLAIDLSEDEHSAMIQQALSDRQSWLPVVDGSADQIVGGVLLRDILGEPERPLEQLVMPVKFVPEVARVVALLEILREERTSEAVVVDEWGGTAGIVTIEDVLEEIVGELRVEGEAREKPVVPLGEGRFRVSGSLSVRDWNELFGRRIVPTEYETVAGLVTAMLGRIPRQGDQVKRGNLVWEVHEVQRRRILLADVWVEESPEPADRSGVPS